MAPDVPPPVCWSIKKMEDVVAVRRYGLQTATAMGFPTPEATKIAVVISELGRNILLYAKEGTITLMPHEGYRSYFKIVAEDHGPGIADLDLVLEGGHTTSNGLGKGISGSKRLMDEFDIDTAPGRGTKITAIKWLVAQRQRLW